MFAFRKFPNNTFPLARKNKTANPHPISRNINHINMSLNFHSMLCLRSSVANLNHCSNNIELNLSVILLTGIISRIEAIPRQRIKKLAIDKKFQCSAKNLEACIIQMPIISKQSSVVESTILIQKSCKTI